ncbi:MAG: exodeoxyribonuclease VII small subunit [Campylobacterota bacterium]|nr:exodeoxyribonuclease VII small subunit [Campylobacterota bacterium]
MNNDVTKITFENKINEAQKILENLIDPEITLSKSVELYKNGIKELEVAQKLLDDAKLEFEELMVK